MRMWIEKSEEIRIGERVLVVDSPSGGSDARPARILEIRRILGKPAYLVETGAGDRKLVSKHQIRREGPSG